MKGLILRSYKESEHGQKLKILLVLMYNKVKIVIHV